MLEGVLVVVVVIVGYLISDVIKLRSSVTELKSDLEELREEVESRNVRQPNPYDF